MKNSELLPSLVAVDAYRRIRCLNKAENIKGCWREQDLKPALTASVSIFANVIGMQTISEISETASDLDGNLFQWISLFFCSLNNPMGLQGRKGNGCQSRNLDLAVIVQSLGRNRVNLTAF